MDAFDIRGNPGAFGSATDRLSGVLLAEKWRYGEVEVAEIRSYRAQARVIPYLHHSPSSLP